MSREKNARELTEILNEQVDILNNKHDDSDIRTAESMANLIGKIIKYAALEISYAKDRKKEIPTIPSLERD